jgi:ketosteroid isomerase-like protein
LRGLKFDWGRQDTLFDHIAGAQDLSNQLREYGVPHEAEEHEGGFRDRHWGEDGRFYTDVLPFFARTLLFGPPTALRDRVTAAHGRLRDAIVANDPEARARLYRADAISMPDYQPALYGPAQIAAYHRAMGERRRITSYVPVTTEVIDLGDGTLFETGIFTIGWTRTAGGASAEEHGKFANVWRVAPDGSLTLKADVAGYLRPLPDPAAFFVALSELPPPAQIPADPRLADILKARNDRNARAVQTHDAAAKIADYADDAIIMPFADTTRTGIGEIRPYLTRYTDNGRGATFDTVRVWNVGYEDHGSYVLEYPKFRVAWHSGDAAGLVKGGGLRLWRRRADGSLELFRQIGTHDFVA